MGKVTRKRYAAEFEAKVALDAIKEGAGDCRDGGQFFGQAGSGGRHRVCRLMGKMGLAPIYQRPRTSLPHPQHPGYAYLLRDLVITRPNQVWCADITYIPMRRRRLTAAPRTRGIMKSKFRQAGGVNYNQGIA